MQLNIDADVTSQYVDGWHMALTITPGTDSAHLSWSPKGYAEDATFEIRLGQDALSPETVEELRRAFEEFPGLDDIAAASWEYFHEQNLWRWADGPWHSAVADLDNRLWRIIDATY